MLLVELTDLVFKILVKACKNIIKNITWLQIFLGLQNDVSRCNGPKSIHDRYILKIEFHQYIFKIVNL